MRLLKLVPDGMTVDYMRLRWITVPISLAAMALSVVLLLTMGLNLGVDFRGGSMLLVQTPQPVPTGAYRDALAPLDLGEVTVTEISGGDVGGEGHQVMVRIASQGGDGTDPAVTDPAVTGPGGTGDADAVARARAALAERLPGLTVLAVESVGGKVSGELVWTGILAVLAAILVVQVYIWARFEWQFALGAGFALVHDTLLTLGLFSALQLEFNLTIVAALLTIVGYSLNDTVVVFDRVRENMRKFKKMEMLEIFNVSTNETMSRTVLTAGMAMIALVALVTFGGDVIRGFTLAMLWGVLVGTYSSVYVAQVIVHWCGLDRKDKPDAKAGTQFANIDA